MNNYIYKVHIGYIHAKYTAKTLYPEFETNILRNETARLRANSYIHVSVTNLYTVFPRSVRSSEIGEPIVGIYKSLTDTF
jgi:hypothetical protein